MYQAHYIFCKSTACPHFGSNTVSIERIGKKIPILVRAVVFHPPGEKKCLIDKGRDGFSKDELKIRRPIQRPVFT